VLVVEDEILLRMDAFDALEAAGYDVVDAANADEAIAILNGRNDIRIVFTDIHMPGPMDGLKLAHFVRDRWPPIKIIATSGYARITEMDLPEGSRFVRKPYQHKEVIGIIDGLVSQ
jgi:CheY-like chemotaxis protein